MRTSKCTHVCMKQNTLTSLINIHTHTHRIYNTNRGQLCMGLKRKIQGWKGTTEATCFKKQLPPTPVHRAVTNSVGHAQKDDIKVGGGGA